MDKEDLLWRVDAAFYMAWPAIVETTIHGWKLRFANNIGRRVNSANPLQIGREDTVELVDICEREFGARHLPSMFRLPSMMPMTMHSVLEQRGYAREGNSLVLMLSDNISGYSDGDVAFGEIPSKQWIEASNQFQKRPKDKWETFCNIVQSISAPTIFASLQTEGRIVSIAYASLCGGISCLESVITDENERGRGFGKRLMRALLSHASAQAEHVCLQVGGDNEKAVALYSQLGFRNLYSYFYMRQPQYG